MRGVMLLAAGEKSPLAEPKTRRTIHSSSNHSGPLGAKHSNTRHAAAAARARSAHRMTQRGLRRSASTPPSSIRATRGTLNASSAAESATAESVRSRTSQASATACSGSPTWEMAWPIHRSRNSREVSGARIRRPAARNEALLSSTAWRQSRTCITRRLGATLVTLAGAGEVLDWPEGRSRRAWPCEWSLTGRARLRRAGREQPRVENVLRFRFGPDWISVIARSS